MRWTVLIDGDALFRNPGRVSSCLDRQCSNFVVLPPYLLRTISKHGSVAHLAQSWRNNGTMGDLRAPAASSSVYKAAASRRGCLCTPVEFQTVSYPDHPTTNIRDHRSEIDRFERLLPRDSCLGPNLSYRSG
jgi:hypothetical protein